MPTELQPYRSRLDDPASKRFGTFSYLPPFDDAGIRAQVQHIIDRGWNCAIEHVEPSRASTQYWYLWKLPMFGERDAEVILAELAVCRAANPHDHVRLIGHDNIRQTLGMSIVVTRGQATADETGADLSGSPVVSGASFAGLAAGLAGAHGAVGEGDVQVGVG